MSSPTTVLTTSTAAQSFNVDSLTGNTQFFFQLTATNESEDSVNSSIVSETTPLDTQWSSVPTLSVPFKTETTYVSDVFAISLTQGTGNTSVTIDDSSIASHLQNNDIEIALSTSDTTPDSFQTLHASGNSQTIQISHTSGVLYFAFRVKDDEGDIDASDDDAFTMSFTNNSITQNVSGVFRHHQATSTDSAASVTFSNLGSLNELSSQTVKLSDNMQISVSGCTVGDTITFRAFRTDVTGDLGDIEVKLGVYDSDGASTPAYDSSGNLKSGATESSALNSAGATTLSGFSVGASGLKRFRARFKATSDGTKDTGPFDEEATFKIQVAVTNTSGTTINNPTLYTFTVTAVAFE